MDNTFKSILGLILICAFIILVLLGQFNTSLVEEGVNNTDDVFVVGFDQSDAPFSYAKDGSYTGFDVELAEEVAKRNNWTLVKEPIIWSEKKELLDSGKVDCVWSAFTIEGRENDYEFTKPYMTNKVVTIVRSDSDIYSFADLKGKKVEFLKGAPIETQFNTTNKTFADTFASKTPVKTYGMSITNLYSRGSDAMFTDVAISNYHVKHSNGYLRVLNEVFAYEHYGVGFKKGNTELRDKVQATLLEMAKDGTIDRIAEKYDDYGLKNNLCI